MYHDIQATIYITNNPMFHEQIKYIEINCYFIKETVMKRDVCIPYIKSKEQLGDIFTQVATKSFFVILFQAEHVEYLCSNSRKSVKNRVEYLSSFQ